MSNIYFTSDMHLGHENIIQYCNRPFKNIAHMNETLIENWNKIVTPDDLVYHLGDFAYKGQKNAKYWQGMLNGDIVHIRGNHDKNNGVKTLIDKCMMYFGGKDVYVSHYPPEIIPACDFCLCGHVHDKWKEQYLEYGDKIIPVINMSTDVWGFTPIKLENVLKYYNKLMKVKVKK